ncbi:MAG: non-canonical purine NTP pyrophosphatase [Solirubrobacteraceae bacterium]
MELVLATGNAHKLAEFRRLLAPAGIEVVPVPASVALPPEDGQTFAENALPKARAAAKALNRVAIADDSGIEAEALGGAPGVRSARFAGEQASDEQNLAMLIAEAPVGSGLRYVCALAYVDLASGVEQLFTGVCNGVMASQRSGQRGFGYDPVFVVGEPPELAGRTMAELGDAQKDRVSHRGAAVRQLLAWLGR